MKIKLLTFLFLLAIGFGNVNTARAEVDNTLDVVGDLALVRPGCLVTTIVGSAIFVVSLPISALSGSVKQTAHTLVVYPAQATFTRPLGDFSTLN